VKQVFNNSHSDRTTDAISRHRLDFHSAAPSRTALTCNLQHKTTFTCQNTQKLNTGLWQVSFHLLPFLSTKYSTLPTKAAHK